MPLKEDLIHRVKMETKEETECVTKEKATISTDTFTKEMKQDWNCNTLKDELKGNTLSIAVECTNQMGKAKKDRRSVNPVRYAVYRSL